MNLEDSRRQLVQQRAILGSLKPRTRGQLALIDAMRAAVDQLDDAHSLAGLVERQLRAGWKQLDELQAALASVMTEQSQPDLDETAEIEIADVETPPSLQLMAVTPE